MLGVPTSQQEAVRAIDHMLFQANWLPHWALLLSILFPAIRPSLPDPPIPPLLLALLPTILVYFNMNSSLFSITRALTDCTTDFALFLERLEAICHAFQQVINQYFVP